jgi:hypothetical protein
MMDKPVHKKGDNHRGISLLSTSYKMLSNILLSRLGPYTEEIIGDYQCGFRHNGDHQFGFRHDRLGTYQIFCICQILEKKL